MSPRAKKKPHTSTPVPAPYTLQVNTRLSEAQLAALKAIQVRVGIPVSEQVRRAITAWLEVQR